MMKRWGVMVVGGLLVGMAGPVWAEEITLTTYYPSPRGVYDQLRTKGDVHIGNFSDPPSARLHVVGGGSTVFRADDTSGDTSPFLIDSGGNVGIGTTGPKGKLDVSGGVAIGSYAGVNSPPSNGMIVSGSVGIGKTSASAPLDVLTSGSTTPAIFAHTNGSSVTVGQGALDIHKNTGGPANIALTSAPSGGPNVGIMQVGLGSGAGYITVAGQPLTFSTESQERMRITGTGEVAIRTPGGWNAWLGVAGDGTKDVFNVRGASGDPSSAFIVNEDGHVGMGASPGANRMYVVGDASVSGGLTVTGNVTVGGTVTASSDARFKTNIMPLTHVLDRLDAVRGVSFEWNELYEAVGYQPDGKPHIGLIAQELEEVFPELVTSSGSEQYRAVDYGKLTAVLLEAVKELKAGQDALRQRVVELEARGSQR